MPFDLVNAPASFQAFIHEALKDFLDQFVVVYLDDILIFSRTDANHPNHVRLVLERLRRWNLHAKLSKCLFSVQELEFLDYILSTKGIAMNVSRIATVLAWPEPRNHREVQIFLGFANFYRRFIEAFSRIAEALTSLLKGGNKGRFRGGFVFNADAKKAFEALKIAFTSASMLLHFDLDKRSQLETNASDFALSAIISQLVESTGQWHSIAFWSRKMTPAEINYEIDEKEMLAIVEACKTWRHYLEEAKYPIRAITDHFNLRIFLTTKTLSRREARWWERLSSLDLQIEYRPEKKNPADGPSRRPDYVDAGSVPLRRDEITLPSLEAIEEDREIRVRSWTIIEEKGLEFLSPYNHDSQGETREISSSAVARMDAASNAARVPVPEIQAVVRRSKKGKGKKVALPKTDETTADFKSMRFRLIESNRDAECQRVINATEKEVAFASPPLELRIVLRILQETDHLAMRRRPRAASSPSWDLRQGMKVIADELGSGDELPSNDKEDSLWHVKDDILCRENRWYILPDLLRTELLKRNHDDLNARHFDVLRTTELIKRKYYWPRMTPDIKQYVDACTRCHQVKASRHKPYEELQSLPVPSGPRQHWTLDFITDLPSSIRRALFFDAILVIIDRYTKYARYISARMDWTAENLADSLIEEVFTRFEMLVSLVIDRETLFTSNYWSNFCYHLRVRLGYSTTFHPQTDGQTERQNQTLEQYLRCYVNYQQDDWVFWLSMTEYAYNNSRHSVTGISPFESLFGEAPRWVDTILDERSNIETPATKERARETAKKRAQMEMLLAKAAEDQAKYYNLKHTPMTYNVGDKVLLNAKNIISTRPSKKLDYKYYGSYEITESIGKQAYRLKLSSLLKGIHNVFHVSLLEPHLYDSARAPELPPTIEVDGEDQYEVDEVLDTRIRYEKLQYLIRWKEYSDFDNQWIAVKDMEGSQDLIRSYHELYPLESIGKRRRTKAENP
jgi:hypothetical protein